MPDATKNKLGGSCAAHTFAPSQAPGSRASLPGCTLCPAPGCFANIPCRNPASCCRATASTGAPGSENTGWAAAILPGERQRLPTPACTLRAGHRQRRSKRVNMGQGRDAAGSRAGHGGHAVAGMAGTMGTSHLPAVPVEGEGAERALSSAGRGDPACSAGAAPARSNPGGCRVPAHSWRRKGEAGWRPGIFRSFSSLSAEMKERPGFICHSSAAAQSCRRRVMSLRHRPMPSGQNATRSLETGEYRAASESLTECRARRRDQQILTALWLGRSAGSGGAWGDGSAGSWGAGTLLTWCQATLCQGQLPHMGQGAGLGGAGRTRSTGAPQGYGTRMPGALRLRLCASSAGGCCALWGFAALLRGRLGTQDCLSIPSPWLPLRQWPQDHQRGEVT